MTIHPMMSCNFAKAAEEVVVPTLKKLRDERLKQLGLDSLRPWDTVAETHEVELDALNRPALKPYDTIDEFVSNGEQVFKQIDGELGVFFQTMREKNLLDLDGRKGKAPGAYCSLHPVERQPFIFQNAVGKAGDVATLLHEAGHAFHVAYSFGSEAPHITGFFGIPSEFAEVASITMELLGMPYLDGYFNKADSARYQVEQLNAMIFRWSYIPIVVLFQHWVYTNHDLATDPAECDKKWTELWLRYMPGINYDSLDDWVATGWHRKLHIFMIPFYYIDYALAQLGAVQIWRNALNDWSSALEAYRSSLKLANSRTLPELYAAAGVKFAFDAETLQQAMDLINEQINKLKAS